MGYARCAVGMRVGFALLGLACAPGALNAQNVALPPYTAGTFPAFGAGSLLYKGAFGNSSVTQDVIAPENFSLSFDAAAQQYTFRRNANERGFIVGTSQVQAITAKDTTYSYYPYPVTYGYEKLILRNNTENNPVQFSYLSYLVDYTQTHVSVGSDDFGAYAGVFGETTPATALPHNGLAYYRGLVDGIVGSSRLSGTGDLLVNLFSGEIATGLDLVSEGSFLGRVDGRGSIANGSSRFAGDLFGSGNALLGRFSGGFFGPTAQEAGYAFTLESGMGNGRSTSSVAGVLVASSADLPTQPVGPQQPTPAMTPVNGSLLSPLASERFDTSAGRLMRNAGNAGYNFYSSTSVAVAEALDRGALTISYDAATQGYTVADGAATTTFTTVDQTASNSVTTRYVVKGAAANYYTPTADQYLTLFNAGAANPTLQLTYLSYGLWTDGEAVQQSQSNYRAFIFGVETPAANLPHSGLALYDGTVDGYWSDAGSIYRLQGSDGSILANFYSGEVRTTMRLAPQSTSNYAPAPIRVDGYGSIAGGTSRFSGAASTADASYSGRFQGGLYGPAFEEAGLTFVLRGPTSTSSLTGALVAKQVPLH